MDSIDQFISISPASSSSASDSGHSTLLKDDFISSFTTLDDVDDDDVKTEISNDKGLGMITPPMSQKQQMIKTPPSVNSKVITRVEFVDSLISAASILLEFVWPQKLERDQLRWFLKETLRRSRSSYCTLQVALFYIYKLKPMIKSSNSTVFQCPKRCFLTCLILASKFLQDRNYSMKTWSKISGLALKELISMEFTVLQAMDYDLNLKSQLYSEWSKLLLACTYVNNSCASSNEGTLDLNIATLFGSKNEQLALILSSFSQKVKRVGTNATSSNTVVTQQPNNNTRSKRRLDDSNDNDRSKLIKI